MTLKSPRLPIVEGTAQQVLKELEIATLPIDPIAIAEDKEIVVQAKPKENDGFSGLLARSGETYGIMYSTFIDSIGFQRFSVAHELGHYFLPGHVEQVLKSGVHRSRAGFSSGDPYEQEADLFAAALLMPSGLIEPLISRSDEGLDLVINLSERCGTSLTAAAIRYARFTRSAVAVVQATNGVVDFATFSEAMKDAKVRWLRRGEAVPATSLTARIAADRKAILRADREADEANLIDWFECPRNHTVVEDVIGLGRYEKTLTVIYSKRLTAAAEGLEDEDEEEVALAESWTPRFRR